MRYYDEVFSEIILFIFIKYIIFMKGSLSLAYIVLFKIWMMSNQDFKDEVPAARFLDIGLIMLAIAEFLTTLTKLRIGITANFFQSFPLALSSLKHP